MRQARQKSEELGLAGISLSRAEALIVCEQLREVGVKKMVEIGTLTGLSALYWLETMSESSSAFKLWTIEKSEEHAAAARDTLADYIQNDQCCIVVGDARVKLSELEREGPFDAVFIDGNKAAYLDYFQWAAKFVRRGGVIIVDNIFLSGAVWSGETAQRFNEKQIRAVCDVNEAAFENSEFRSTIIPTEEGLLICKMK